MISLKHYLNLGTCLETDPVENQPDADGRALVSTLRGILMEFGECSAEACPDLRPELGPDIARILETLGPAPANNALVSAEAALRNVLRRWAKNTARHCDTKVEEVRDSLLVMARTAESLSHRDDQYERQLDNVTSQLESIASLEDVSRI